MIWQTPEKSSCSRRRAKTDIRNLRVSLCRAFISGHPAIVFMVWFLSSLKNATMPRMSKTFHMWRDVLKWWEDPKPTSSTTRPNFSNSSPNDCSGERTSPEQGVVRSGSVVFKRVSAERDGTGVDQSEALVNNHLENKEKLIKLPIGWPE